ncbi:hypothetical protein T265_11385 [Opisthorchis viverrini]|uniref:Uncharacterized protein n=1 Tax=Opisthorchis viverrini TaxID=6198 RepID=A0A074Z9P8_OPIVI|nr:hypothetical protein T265_11385 [Opisthorchis viverrini]KER19970.1 hypothetical protein T265_11385 [Opisthorchis viverrini]
MKQATPESCVSRMEHIEAEYKRSYIRNEVKKDGSGVSTPSLIPPQLAIHDDNTKINPLASLI